MASLNGCPSCRAIRRLWDPRSKAVSGRPRHQTVVRFAAEHGLSQVGNSDAHALDAVGIGWTTFPGRTEHDLRAAIAAGTTHQHGSFHGTTGQLATFSGQLRKYSRDARASVGARVRRSRTGRDLGYPGGTHRPPRFEETWERQRTEAGLTGENRQR